MEVSNKQKLKKRKTRRNLEEIRIRSRGELKTVVNQKKKRKTGFKTVSRYMNNVQIASKRLTLALCNKIVTSKTATRVPLSRNNVNSSDGNIKENIFCLGFKPSNENNYPGSSFDDNKDLSIRTSNVHMEVQNYNTSFIMSVNDTPDTGIGNCIYNKFIDKLPEFFKEHYPMLFDSDSDIGDNISVAEQYHWERVCQETNVNDDSRASGGSIVQSPSSCRETLAPNTMDSVLWQHSVEKNIYSFSSSVSSPSLSPLNSSSFNITVPDSPEYIYFPHKLNQ